MREHSIDIGHNQPPPAFLIRPQPELSRAPARIFLRQAPGLTSGRARNAEWVLRFDRQQPPLVDPLTGWTGCDDPQSHVEITFGSQSEAIRYAEDQGLAWRITNPYAPDMHQTRKTAGTEASGGGRPNEQFAGTVAWWLSLQGSYGRCIPSAMPDLDRALVNPAAAFAAPDDVLRHPLLTVDCKREILQRWAWDEYLLELALADGMPEGEPSRLPEVKAALRVLDTKWSPDPAAPAAFAAVYEQHGFQLAA